VVVRPAKSLGGLKTRIEQILISKLTVDRAYQRNVNERHVRKMAENFDPDAFQTPLVCKRLYKGGENVVIDSQQRVVAAALAGYTSVTASVVELSSIEEEANLFGLININRKAVPTPVTHRNNLLRGDEKSLKLEGAVRAGGMLIGERYKNNVLKATSRIQVAASYYGYDCLTKAVVAYRTIWPHHTRVHGYLLCGLTFLIWAYTTDEIDGIPVNPEAVEPEALARKIARVFPTWDSVIDEMKRKRLKLSEAHRLESDHNYATTLLHAYNFKLRDGKGGSGTLKSQDLTSAFRFKKVVADTQ
jgi:hypothetical protein